MGALQEAFTSTTSLFRRRTSMVTRSRFLAAAAAALATFALTTGCNKQPAPSPDTTTQSSQPANPQIGGEAVVKLTRNATSNGQQPEFLSLTALPGRGMEVFQITANVPGKGE